MNTAYYRNLVLRGLFMNEELPKEYYIGFSKTVPDQQGGNVDEPFYDTAYRRVRLRNMGVLSEGTVQNEEQISFNQSETAWGQIRAYVVYDREHDGHLLFYGETLEPFTVDANTVVTIAPGEFRITLLE